MIERWWVSGIPDAYPSVSNTENAWSGRPLPVFPELYLELDLMLLGALESGDDQAKTMALATADVEILWRLGHLSESWVTCRDAPFTVSALEHLVPRFAQVGEPEIGQWLREVLAVWAHIWHETFSSTLVSIAQASVGGSAPDILSAADDAVDLLNNRAVEFVGMEFASIPARRTSAPCEELAAIATDLFRTHRERVSLRILLDGAGGLAAAPEHNPLAAAIFEFDAAVYRRLYRMFYELMETVGCLDGEGNADGHFTPDEIDQAAY